MSTKEDIKNFILTNPVYIGTLPADLTDSYSLIESGILDSIGIYTLIIYLEKKFSIKIEITDIKEKNFSNLNAINDFLKQKGI